MGGHCDRVSDRKRRMNGFKHDRETGGEDVIQQQWKE